MTSSCPARPTGPPGVPVRVKPTEQVAIGTVAAVGQGAAGRYTELAPSTSLVTMYGVPSGASSSASASCAPSG